MTRIDQVTLLVLLSAAVVCDLEQEKIPNALVSAGMVCALAGHLLRSGPRGLADAAAGFALLFLLTVWLWLFRMIGAGDIKLLSMAGSFAGPRMAFHFLICSFLIGSLISLVLLIRRGNFLSRFQYFINYFKTLPECDSLPAYLPGVTQDGRMCFSVPVLAGVWTTFLLETFVSGRR